MGRLGNHVRASNIRKIVVHGQTFQWFLKGNSLDSGGDKHISVFASRAGQRLLIDPYAWHIEIRPRTVAEAIRFSLSQGWQPNEVRAPMYLSRNDDGFYVLPEGVRYSSEIPPAT